MSLETLEKHELIHRVRHLEKEIEELKLLNKNNKAWLALLSHDFKGTFANLLWVLNMYKSKSVPFKILEEVLPELEINTQKNIRALDDTFLAALIHYDNFLTQKEPINLAVIFEEIKSSLFDKISEKGLTLESVINTETNFEANKLIIKSILFKVIDNAIKFSFKGNKIIFSVDIMENNKTCITVEDFGTGMDDYTRNKLFSLDASPTLGTEGEKGAGLGLILAKEALTLINGTIHIQSVENKGTQVRITI